MSERQETRVGAGVAVASKKKKSIKHKTYTNTLPAFACWVKKVSVGGGAIFIRKICASALFINPQMDPYKVVHGRDHVGKVGILSGGRVCVSFPRNVTSSLPASVPSWSASASKPGDTADPHHLRLPKKFKKGNPTPLTQSKELQRRKFD